MNRNSGILGNLDPWLVFFYFFLVIFGWANIYSSSITEESRQIFNLTTSHGKQLLWMGICFALAFFIMLFDSRFYNNFWFVFYGGSLALLVLVLIIGKTVDGNKSWIELGSFIKIQPSEFAKVATAIVLARIMSGNNFSFKPNNNNRAVLSFRGIPIIRTTKEGLLAIFAVLLPAALVLAENDTGSTLVYTALFLAMFRFGLPWILLIMAASTIVLFLSTVYFEYYYHFSAIITIIVVLFCVGIIIYFLVRNFIFSLLITLFCCSVVISTNWVFHNVMKEHHRTRVYVLLGIVRDYKGAGWNVTNSKIAIGSGGFAGKGFMKGSFTKLKFIPKQRTDFIFSTVGEEWGFWGSTLVLLIYLAFLIRLVIAADRQRNRFHMVYGYCVACLMFFHYYMNVGTTIGLAPVVGIPLPFFSYGGSSLLGFTILLWIFIKMDSQNMQILR